MLPTPRVDTVGFFERLAAAMNAHPERFEPLGDVDLVLGVVIARPDGERFGARIVFEGIACADVSELPPDGERAADCWLEGPLSAWQEMADDIVAHGRATGRHTLNSLTLLGDPIRLDGSDVMGVDRFSRFNQTLQEFFDGAAATHATPSPA